MRRKERRKERRGEEREEMTNEGKRGEERGGEFEIKKKEKKKMRKKKACNPLYGMALFLFRSHEPRVCHIPHKYKYLYATNYEKRDTYQLAISHVPV